MTKTASRILAGLIVSSAMASPAMAQSSGDIIPDSYICVFNAKAVNKGAVVSEAKRAANAAGRQVGHVYTSTIRGFSTHMNAKAVAQMQARNPSIKYCEADRVIALGPVRIAKGKPGGGSSAPAQTTPWGIDRVNGGAAGSYATAWVIDSGIDGSHPDLNVDANRSASFLPRDSSWDDQNGHGTHVAGTIAALDNAIGVIGVAPGAPVVAVRVLDRRGSGSYSGVIAGVDYVGANGKAGDVANMSLGGPTDTALNEAVIAAASKGVRFTLAAGNESDNAANHSPASANGANVYTVSAFAQGDTWASFSNYGNPPIDYAEPGVSITSTYKDEGYATLSGTSMAAPHLAGILLLGSVRSGGTVSGDPAGPADTIGIH
ncbi:S8 family serine peptidase [Novosphingobium sp. YJ-S2-02]|uniref:S8 family serine peptidase n=1 Tax=Novosphingobium aureum TaxID=2792964 RepID=A0A931MK48_9SPHN|nr:S8 family serine peptidase [Novosphingobium aureum]MBH0112522.1 S8 family serine peptidase [Novosphingobium aureum]